MSGELNAAPKRVSLCLCVAACLLISRAGGPSGPAEAAAGPAVTTSWVGNTFGKPAAGAEDAMRFVGGQSLIGVDRDGTVYTCAPREDGHRAHGVYKNGDALPSPDVRYGASAVAVTDTHVYLGARVGAAYGIIKYKRNGSLLERVGFIEVNKGTHGEGDVLSGLALDVRSDRLYVSDPATDRVRIFKASDLSLSATGREIIAERPGPLVVDADGNLWVSQMKRFAGHRKLAARPINSLPLSGKTDGGNVLDDAWDTFFCSATDAGSYVGVDLGPGVSEKIAVIRYQADPADEIVGGRFQGSADGEKYADLVTINKRPLPAWNQVGLAAGKSYRYVRYVGPAGSRSKIRGMELYAPVPERDGKVVKYDRRGVRLPPEINAISHPVALCYERANGRLLVADGGPNQQIVAFTGLSQVPKVDPTWGNQGRLGVRGGVFAGKGAAIGTVRPLRFHNLAGVDLDLAGNVYVAGGAKPLWQDPDEVSGTVLEAYTPAGKRLWRLENQVGQGVAGLDPLSAEDAYVRDCRLRMDWGQPAGAEWSAKGQSLNRFKYPEDMRLRSGASAGVCSAAFTRRIGGQPFLFVTGRDGDLVGIFRFKPTTDGVVAIPCAMIFGSRVTGKGGAYPDVGWPPHQPQGCARMFWLDKNGNGRFDASEYVEYPSDKSGIDGWFVDNMGGFWFFDRTDGRCVRKIVAGGLDANGVPRYAWNAAANGSYPLAAPFDANHWVCQVSPDPANLNTVFATGFTAKHNKTLADSSPQMGRVMVRYTVFDNKLINTHETTLPYDDADANVDGRSKVFARSFSIAGEYIFIGYGQTAMVRVLLKADLSHVTDLRIGPQVGTVGIESKYGLNVCKPLVGDEYVLFIEAPGDSRVTMLRWLPNKDVPAAPAGLKAALSSTNPKSTVDLTWADVTGSPPETGYRIERRQLTADGWAGWTEVQRSLPADTTKYTDSGLDEKGTYAYRIRGFNDGAKGGNSDYSASVAVTTD